MNRPNEGDRLTFDGIRYVVEKVRDTTPPGGQSFNQITLTLRRERASIKAAKSKPSSKHQGGWRKMSSVPHEVAIEVKLTTEGTAVSRVITTKVDDFGFKIDRVYWARFAPDGRDRLAAWRPIE